MNDQEVIYKGRCFTVMWYVNQNGKSQPRDYFLDSSKKERAALFALIERIADLGTIRDITKFRNEGDGIYAFKPKPNRYLSFFMKGKRIIIIHAFVKKSDKMPAKEKAMAISRMSDYLERHK